MGPAHRAPRRAPQPDHGAAAAASPASRRVPPTLRCAHREAPIVTAHFILFVADQAAAGAFYRKTLDCAPRLEVPGMTEIEIGGAVLGLMPRAGAARVLGDANVATEAMPAAPAELYLMVDDPAAYWARAVAAGATPLSPIAPRNWGHEAGYLRDADGHVIAFARALPSRDV